LEGGEAEGLDQLEMIVTQQLEGEMQPFDGFLLILRVLRAEAEDSSPEGFQLGVVVAEGAGLGGAAAGSGDVVPAGEGIAVGTAGVRVEVDDGTAREGREVHLTPGRRGQRNRGEAQAREVVAGAVVQWNRESLGQGVEIVAAGHDPTSSPAGVLLASTSSEVRP